MEKLSIVSFIFLISHISSISSNKSCEPGFYINDDSCVPCPGGYYSDEEDSEKCYPCLAGTYSKTASSSCKKCPPGSFSPKNSNICLPCPAGTHMKKEGKEACIPCLAGKFSHS